MHNNCKQPIMGALMLPCCVECNWQETGIHQLGLWAGVILSTPRPNHEADDRALRSGSTGAVRLASSEAFCLALQCTCSSVSEGLQGHAQGS